MKIKLLFYLMLCCLPLLMNGQWTQQSTGFPNVNTAVKYLNVVDQNVIWLTGTNQTTEFAVSANGGNSFVANSIPAFNSFGASMIFGINGLTAWMPVFSLAGNGGAILKTEDGGVSWTHQTSATFTGPSGFPNVIHFWDANNGVCMGDPNNGFFEIYTTTNGGSLWTRVADFNIPYPFYEENGMVGYYCVVDNTIWFTTSKSRIFKSTDKGATWSAFSIPVNGYGAKVVFKDISHGLLLRNSTPARLYESFDGGESWNEIEYVGYVQSFDICYVPGTNNTWINTGNNTNNISFSKDGGHIWQKFDTNGMNFGEVSFVSPTLGWAGGLTTSTSEGGINKFTGTIVPLVNDVAISTVDILPILKPDIHKPSATFVNLGSATQSFDVIFRKLGGVYNSTVAVNNLQTLESITVEFEDWTADVGTHIMKVEADLPSDEYLPDNKENQTIKVLDYTQWYGYNAYDPSGEMARGPCYVYPEEPSVIVPIDNHSSFNILNAGSWGPNGIWYACSILDGQSNTGGNLVSINKQTGERTVIGFMQYYVAGLSYDYISNKMYAVSNDSLYTVNLSSGALTGVAPIGSTALFNLACNSQGELFSVNVATDMFGSIDKLTGAFTPLFPIGFDAGYAQDMEFDRYTDTCYYAGFDYGLNKGALYAIDVASSSITKIGNFQGGAEITGFAIPYSTLSVPSNNLEALDLHIWPNPSSEYVNLSCMAGMDKIELFNIDGKLLLNKIINDTDCRLNVDELPSGIYMFSITTKSGVIVKEFIKY